MSLVEELKSFLEEKYEAVFENDEFLREWDFYSQGFYDGNDRPVKEIIEKFGSYRLIGADRTDSDKDEIMQVSYFEKYDKYIACYGAHSSHDAPEFTDDLEELIPEEKTVLKFEKNEHPWCYLYVEI